MPEIGDRVNVHFATRDESDAVVINSIKHALSGGFQRKSPETAVSQVSGAKAAASVTEMPAAASAAEGAPVKNRTLILKRWLRITR